VGVLSRVQRTRCGNGISIPSSLNRRGLPPEPRSPPATGPSGLRPRRSTGRGPRSLQTHRPGKRPAGHLRYLGELEREEQCHQANPTRAQVLPLFGQVVSDRAVRHIARRRSEIARHHVRFSHVQRKDKASLPIASPTQTLQNRIDGSVTLLVVPSEKRCNGNCERGLKPLPDSCPRGLMEDHFSSSVRRPADDRVSRSTAATVAGLPHKEIGPPGGAARRQARAALWRDACARRKVERVEVISDAD